MSNLAANLLIKLNEISVNGLNPVYKNFEEYMWDMYADLNWTVDGFIKDVNYILRDEQFPAICERISEKYGVDLKSEFITALRERRNSK
jgi:hypothetical protein